MSLHHLVPHAAPICGLPPRKQRDQVRGSLEATHIERGKPRFRKGPEIPFSSTLSGQSCTSEMPVLVWPSSSVRAWN